MIRMKKLITSQGDEGLIQAGQIFFARNQRRADELEKRGLAVPSPAKIIRPPRPEMGASIPRPEIEATTQGPLPSIGGPIGVEPLAQSLRVVRPRAKSRRMSKGKSKTA